MYINHLIWFDFDLMKHIRFDNLCVLNNKWINCSRWIVWFQLSIFMKIASFNIWLMYNFSCDYLPRVNGSCAVTFVNNRLILNFNWLDELKINRNVILIHLLFIYHLINYLWKCIKKKLIFNRIWNTTWFEWQHIHSQALRVK